MTAYIGCLLPTKTALKKNKLETLTRALEAPNKKLAEALLTTQFYTDHSELVSSYHDVKVCEDKPGMPRPAFDVWDTTFTWNKDTGEVELIVAAEPERTEEEVTSVMKLPTNFRAAVLVLFGPVEGITKAEYSRVIDLVNDDDASPARELAEAISRTPRVLALLPERQAELLAAVREDVKETAQWTDFKKFMDKWLDITPEKRDAPAKVKPAAAPEYVSLTFEQKIAVVINAPAVELDEVTPEILSDATNQRKCEYPAFIRAHKALTYIQPTLEKFSDRLLGSAIRSVDFNEDKGIVAYRRAVLDYLGVNGDVEEEDENEHNISDAAVIRINEDATAPELAKDTTGTGAPAQEVKPGRNTFTLDELIAGPDDKRPSMNDREIEIVHALNDLLSGHTGIMSKEEAEGIVTCTGHLVSYVTPLLLRNIESAEFCLHPDFSDGEIHDVATTILDSWSDNDAFRQKLALDAIVEYRKPSNGFVQKADSVNHEMVQKGESVNQYAATSPFTYHQQLTIAAIQGLCANPAYAMCETPLSEIADTIANSVIYLQGADNENHL